MSRCSCWCCCCCCTCCIGTWPRSILTAAAAQLRHINKIVLFSLPTRVVRHWRPLREGLFLQPSSLGDGRDDTDFVVGFYILDGGAGSCVQNGGEERKKEGGCSWCKQLRTHFSASGGGAAQKFEIRGRRKEGRKEGRKNLTELL